MSDELFMQPERICELVIDLTTRCAERASFFLAGAGLGSYNPELTLAAGAFAAPMSVETGKRTEITYDDFRIVIDTGLVLLGYATTHIFMPYYGL